MFGCARLTGIAQRREAFLSIWLNSCAETFSIFALRILLSSKTLCLLGDDGGKRLRRVFVRVAEPGMLSPPLLPRPPFSSSLSSGPTLRSPSLERATPTPREASRCQPLPSSLEGFRREFGCLRPLAHSLFFSTFSSAYAYSLPLPSSRGFPVLRGLQRFPKAPTFGCCGDHFFQQSAERFDRPMRG